MTKSELTFKPSQTFTGSTPVTVPAPAGWYVLASRVGYPGLFAPVPRVHGSGDVGGSQGRWKKLTCALWAVGGLPWFGAFNAVPPGWLFADGTAVRVR